MALSRKEWLSSADRAALQVLAERVADRASRSAAPPVCVFLGAGAAISSGGLTFSHFKRLAIEEILGERVFEISTDGAVDERFEQVFATTAPGERALLVERLFRSMAALEPSDSYKLLVLLAEAGGIDAVVTTNFDVMLETAETAVGCDVFQVFAAGTARPFPMDGPSHGALAKPYLKLHGDLNARAVSHLTGEELREGGYDPYLLGTLREVLATHVIAFAGYGGFDAALAEIINQLLPPTATPFWCNPSPPSVSSPLFQRIGARCRIAAVEFDELIATIARPVLQRPRFAPRRTTYIRRLFDWRVDHCNETFFGDYGQRPSRACALSAHRPAVERTIGSFLASDKSLAIISGPSGFGKTTVGVRLYDSWRDHPSRTVILLTAKSLAGPDIEFHLAERLGGLGPPAPLSLAVLERWLRDQRIQMVVFVDALNEYSTELNDCALLLRNIARLCYYLPERNSALRVLATIRQETWNSILPRLDTGALRQTLWSPSGVADSVETIPIGPLTNDELRDAIDRRREQDGGELRFENLSATAVERLRDPFLLGAVACAPSFSALTGPTSSLYRLSYGAQMARNGAGVDASTLQDALARLALRALTVGDDLFRAVDVTPEVLRLQILRAAGDLGILSETADGRLRFRHDRLQEYFLSIGLTLPEAPFLGTLTQLRDYLTATRHNAKARAAARMFFAAARPERFRTIELAMMVRSRELPELSNADRHTLFSFAQEVTYELAEAEPALAAQYIRAGLRAAEEGRVDQLHLRTLIQCAATLPDEMAIPALVGVPAAGDDLATTEADIYIAAKLMRQYLWNGAPALDFQTTTPYNLFCGDTSIPPWQQLGRVMRLLGRAGADNLHQEEHAAVKRALGPALATASGRLWSPQDVAAFSDYLRSNCDRLLFNATTADLDDFFANADRSRLATVLQELESGLVLQPHHLEVLNPYIRSMDFVLKPQNVEYNIAQAFFVLSAMNDLGATLEFWEHTFSGFDDTTPPTEVDFYQGLLVYLHTLFAIPYDPRLAKYEERVLRDWPTVLRCRPGLARGHMRGFRDEFDMVFEDGFGVVYPYGLLTPTRLRRRLRYRDYLRELDDPAAPPPLPLYTEYLRRFLSEGRAQDSLQLIQALNDVIVAWPVEGLTTLRDAIGHSDPLVHRAVVRVLAEAYVRYPGETVRFLRTSGGALTEHDLQEIKIRQDPRVGRRQVSQQEWSRVGSFLLGDRSAVRTFIRCLRILLTTGDLEAAVDQITRELGLSAAT